MSHTSPCRGMNCDAQVYWHYGRITKSPYPANPDGSFHFCDGYLRDVRAGNIRVPDYWNDLIFASARHWERGDYTGATRQATFAPTAEFINRMKQRYNARPHRPHGVLAN